MALDTEQSLFQILCILLQLTYLFDMILHVMEIQQNTSTPLLTTFHPDVYSSMANRCQDIP
jgi:hypothetical protein